MRENSEIVLIAVDRHPKLCYDIATMDPNKDKVLTSSPAPIQGQPAGVLREREISTSLESPLDPEVAKIVQVIPDHTNEPSVNFPQQPQVNVQIEEPKIQVNTSISKAEAQTIIRKYSPDNPKRGKAVIIVRESDIRDLRSKNAF